MIVKKKKKKKIRFITIDFTYEKNAITIYYSLLDMLFSILLIIFILICPICINLSWDILYTKYLKIQVPTWQN